MSRADSVDAYARTVLYRAFLDLKQKDPQGFTVKTTGAWVLILTGPNGKTNYMFPSAAPASTLGGHPLSCGVPAQTGCPHRVLAELFADLGRTAVRQRALEFPHTRYDRRTVRVVGTGTMFLRTLRRT